MNNMLRFSIFSSIILFSPHVYAQSSYVGPLNAGLGNGASASCGACHTSGGQSGGNATLPMAGTWRSGAHLALSDTDGDGFNNAQEVSGAATNFNYNTISPFTLAKAAEGSTSNNVVVTGAGIVTETVITNAATQTGISLASGHTLAGSVSPLINTFPATVTFNQAVNTGDKVYVVDLVAKTNTLVSTATFNANGSVTISGVTGPANIIVDRATPIVPAPGPTRGGEDEEEFECVTGQLSTPLLMFLAMLSLGFMVKHKQA